jgi:hypothetical protein
MPALADWVEAALVTRWTWSEFADAVTDQHVSQAYLQTTRINDEVLGEDFARLMLSCLAGKPEIQVDWTFKAGGKANLVLEYRFDGLPGRRLKARYVNSGRQRSDDLADVRQFLADAKQSTSLYVRARSDQYGTAEATFSARAGVDMVKRFVAACPAASPR